MITKQQRLTGILVMSAIILAIPLIAMQFNDEVVWTLSDFVIAGMLLLGTGAMCELVIRNVNKVSSRIFLVGAILLGLFLVWAELAVGIFGSPFAGS